MQALVPHIYNIYVLLVAYFINGSMLAGCEVGANTILLTIWGKESAPFMLVFTFFYGFGALIAPIIAEPFLVESDSMDDLTLSNYSIEQRYEHFNETRPEDLQLVYPFSIVGLILGLN